MLARALPAAPEAEPEIAHLPPLKSWPRYLRSEGPLYALFQLSPLVAQLGIVKDAKRADSGTGIGLVFGYRKPLGGANSLGFEFIYETSQHHNESSDVPATATRLLGGVRWSFRMDERLVPFALAGGGLYELTFDGLDPKFGLSGLGFMIGGGVDFSPSARFALRAELALHIWDAAEKGSGAGGMAETLTLGLGAAVSF